MKIAIDSANLRLNRKYYTSDASKYCFVPIMKNAHSFGLGYFSSLLDFKEVKNIGNDKEFIIFLRDPMSRWFTGVTEYFYRHYNLEGKLIENPDDYLVTTKDDPYRKHLILDKEVLNFVFNAVRLDYHTDLQIYTLLGLNKHKCVFFNVSDANFSEHLNRFSLHYCKKNPAKVFQDNTKTYPHINSSKGNSFKESLLKQLREYADRNPKLFQNVIDYYYHDYALYRNAKFFRG